MTRQIPNILNKVPMMFRAQIDGRCQLQRVRQNVDEQDAERWVSEWIEKTDSQPPEFGEDVRVQSYPINWRFVTNGGQDDGIVRPVIGARGYPYYPGSSMKGAFRRCCTSEQVQRYCGRDLGKGDFAPGILRFHGGYPTDTRWQDQLLDIIHPQQTWQVQKNQSGSAFAQISLYQPTLKFGISSTISLEESEWETIWNIWKKALSAGIGCRVSAGYGQPQQKRSNVSYKPQLKGRGMAAKLLTGEGEFRPNMFKAALRGHALRLFGGLTTEKNAEALVQQLFGGVQNGATVGLVMVSFQVNPEQLEMSEFGQGAFAVPAYDVTGQLCFSLTQSLEEEEEKALIQVIKALTRFAMVFGGFGKSWRRADHRLFYPEYYKGGGQKPLIGCHWQWVGENTVLNNTRYGVRRLDQVPAFIDKVQQDLKGWMKLQGIEPTVGDYAISWREVWHLQTVQVWGRVAQDAEDCRAIEWLHRPYRPRVSRQYNDEGTIYKSSVTGSMGNIGRIWHRMYPLVHLEPNPDNPRQLIPKPTRRYLELLTFFPSDYPDQQEEKFLDFLEDEQEMFKLLWGS